MLTNDYQKAIEVDGGLFAVQMRDGGWTVADGPGIAFASPGEKELAGYHVPVRFKTEAEAIGAIKNGPEVLFDIATDAEWFAHCVAVGGVVCDAYKSPRFNYP